MSMVYMVNVCTYSGATYFSFLYAYTFNTYSPPSNTLGFDVFTLFASAASRSLSFGFPIFLETKKYRLEDNTCNLKGFNWAAH